MEFTVRVLRRFLHFLTGGLLYFCLELIWRGWSHPALIPVGGLCFEAVAAIGGRARPLALRALGAAAAITGVELVSGCVYNLWLGLEIWDYSALPGNLLGQVCPLYALLWYLLAFPAIALAGTVWRALPGQCRGSG